jgi:hypothetical protein
VLFRDALDRQGTKRSQGYPANEPVHQIRGRREMQEGAHSVCVARVDTVDDQQAVARKPHEHALVDRPPGEVPVAVVAGAHKHCSLIALYGAQLD